MTFKRFVADQTARLSAFEAFARMPEDGKKGFVELLFEKASEPSPRRDRSEIDWYSDEPGRRVCTVIRECLEFENVPSLADIRAVWNRLYPAARQVSPDCTRCAGSGWVTIAGPFGTSAAYPCTHQPESEADRRMGVRIHPALGEYYAALEREAAPRRAIYVGSNGSPNREALQRLMRGRE